MGPRQVTSRVEEARTYARLQGDHQQAGRTTRYVGVSEDERRTTRSCLLSTSLTALLQRVTDVQAEGAKIKSDNETLQTCTCGLLAGRPQLDLTRPGRLPFTDIDNLTRNKYVRLNCREPCAGRQEGRCSVG